MVEDLLGEELQSTFSSQVGYLLSRRAFRRFRKRVDYSEFGGAPLLGVAGLCIVGHGRSSVKAVRNAVAMASRMAAQPDDGAASSRRCAAVDGGAVVIAFVFPGQGSQAVGMGKALADRFDDLRADVRRGRRGARRAAERSDLQRSGGSADAHRKHAARDSDDERRRVAAARRARPRRRRSWPGHSLGEYSAHVAAGTLQFADAVRLVRNRGRYMQEAVPVGAGAMAAILGLDEAGVHAGLRGSGAGRGREPGEPERRRARS